jgi:serine/threonine protein kinase
VLELLDGQTLLQNLQDRSGGLMPPNEVKKIIEGLLKGLAHLHKNRVMHRDLKPENIMIRKQTL